MYRNRRIVPEQVKAKRAPVGFAKRIIAKPVYERREKAFRNENGPKDKPRRIHERETEIDQDLDDIGD